jgi:periplasmic divalent cation tolerance protein
VEVDAVTKKDVPGAGGDVLVCFVTAPRGEAGRIAKTVVDRGLAACCNVVDSVSSYYVWEGRMNVDEEALLVMKTTADASVKLVPLVKEIHPYELPEVVLLRVAGGLEGYLNWVEKTCCHQEKGD